MDREFDPRSAWAGTVRAAPLAALTAALLLGVAVLLAFRGALDQGLVRWDDDIYLERIPQLREWTAGNALWMLTDRSWFYWHPVAYADHAIDLQTFGTDWRMHHLMSLFLHVFNAWWVLLLACAFLGPRKGEAPPARAWTVVGAAFLAALLWALHPLRVESVAWLAEKKDLLCAFFSFAATAAWLLRWNAATVAAFVLALASKPLAVALPVAWVVVDRIVAGRWSHRRALPFLALGFAAVLAGVSGVKEEGRISTPLRLGFDQRILTPLWGFAAPIVKTLAPLGLCPYDAQFPAEEIRLLSVRWGGSLLLLAAGTWWAVRRGGGVAAAWFAYLALAAPVSGIRQLAGLATADRFSYLATVPFYVLAAAGILRAGRWAAVAALLAAAGLFALTVPQVEVWRDPETLWRRVLREWPGRGPEPHDHLGAWYARSGDPARAEAEFRKSLALVERNAAAHNNLARVLEERREFRGAEEHYRRAAALAPRFAVARWNLARLLALKGRRAEAEKARREAEATGGWVDPRLRAEVEALLPR